MQYCKPEWCISQSLTLWHGVIGSLVFWLLYLFLFYFIFPLFLTFWACFDPLTLQEQAWAISGFPVSWLSELDCSVRVHITAQPAPLRAVDCTLMTHPSITGGMCVSARTSAPSRIETRCSEWLQLSAANLQTLVLIGPEWKFRFGFEKRLIRGRLGLASRTAQECLRWTGEMVTWGRGCSAQLQTHVCKGCGAEQGCVICQTLNRVLACGQFRSFPVCFSILAVTVVAAQTRCRAALRFFCVHNSEILFQSFPHTRKLFFFFPSCSFVPGVAQTTHAKLKWGNLSHGIFKILSFIYVYWGSLLVLALQNLSVCS